MKKVILAFLISASSLAFTPVSQGPQAWAATDTATMATTIDTQESKEQETLASLRERIKTVEPQQAQSLSTFILDRITGENGQGVSNPNKREEYYTKLATILAMDDDTARLNALKSFGKNSSNSSSSNSQNSSGSGSSNSSGSNSSGSSSGSGSSGSSGSGSGSNKNASNTNSGLTNSLGKLLSGNTSGNSGSGTGTGSSGSGTSTGSSGSGTSTGSSGSGTSTGGSSNAGTGTATTGDNSSVNSKNGLGGTVGSTCWKAGVKVTAYGYTGDHTPDSNSNYRCKAGGKCVKACEVGGACGIGNRNNLLRDNHSFAVSDDIKSACGLKVGDVICVSVDAASTSSSSSASGSGSGSTEVTTGGGEICGVYEDRSPQTNNVDRYLPNVSAKVGNSYFKRSIGPIKKLTKPVPVIPHPGK